METIILDTDMETDCDDVGALLVLCALARRGAAKIAGVVASVPDPASALYAQWLLSLAGFGAVPVGDGGGYPGTPEYFEHVRRCGPRLYTKVNPPPAPRPGEIRPGVALYRQLLAAAADGEVTVCAIGLHGVLAALLASPPDALSPLPGRELVARKVKRLVAMAGVVWPRGRDRFNLWMDRPAAARTLSGWPTPVWFNHLGESVLTGARMAAAAGAGHPAARAYAIFGGAPGFSRASWDQLTAILACGAAAGLLEAVPGGGLSYDPESGDHVFSGPGHFSYARQLAPDADLAAAVEGLMAEGAGGRG